ncbi:MAG TPA: phosphatase PAP2 family protein [Chloroflexota bacterium]|nr:phosphatase PAP2 family protein [Chloroflexota bacterium]
MLYGRALLCLWQERRTVSGAQAILLGLILGLSAATGKLLNRTVSTQRPYVAGGVPPLVQTKPLSSFPSTHAIQVTALTLQVHQLQPQHTRGTAFGALLVILGRLGTNVHYTRDVLAGAGIASANAWIVRRLPLPERMQQPLLLTLAALRRRLAQEGLVPTACRAIRSADAAYMPAR